MYIFLTDTNTLGVTNKLPPDSKVYLEAVNDDHYSYNYYFNSDTNSIIYDPNNAIALRIQFKLERQQKVNNIEVTYNGNIYQGDETSQNRMTRAILAMTDTETIPWITKDNKNVNLSKVDLSAILKQVGIIQTSLWT